MADVYIKYTDLYGRKYVKECLGHYEGDPNEPLKQSNMKIFQIKLGKQKISPQKQKERHYNLITEIGFAILFLL